MLRSHNDSEMVLMILNSEFDRNIIICAFRYCLPRHTYMPSIMRDTLDEVWSSLDPFARELILKEIVDHKEFLERIYEADKKEGRSGEWSFNDKYDMDEWLFWREQRIFKDNNSNNGS